MLTFVRARVTMTMSVSMLSRIRFAPLVVGAWFAAVGVLGAPRVVEAQSWETWWQYNRPPFLALKSKIYRPQVTEGNDFSLGDPSPENREQFEAPGRAHVRNKVIPALRKAMKNDFFGIRGAAVVALGKIGDSTQYPAIMKLVKDDHKRVRESAILALGALTSPKAVEPLVAIMRDDRKGRYLVQREEILMRERALAASSLGLIGHYVKGVRGPVFESLRKSFDYDQTPKDLPMLILVSLGVMGDARAVPFLTDVLKNPACPDVLRGHAVSSLGKIGKRSSLSLVQKALQDKTNDVVRAAILALGLLAPEEDPQSVRLLSRMALAGREAQGRAWAFLSLGRIGGEDARKLLIHALEEDQDWRRAYAALGLALIARRTGNNSDAELVHKVFRIMEGDGARAGLATALGLMNYQAARGELLELAISKGDPGLKGFCAVSLGLMQARDALPSLKRSLRSRIDPGFQTSVAEAIGMMSDPEVVPILLSILEKAETTYHVSSVIQALGFIADQTAIDPLIEVLEDESASNGNRINAAMALGVLGEARDLPTFHPIQVDSNYAATVGSFRLVLGVQ